MQNEKRFSFFFFIEKCKFIDQMYKGRKRNHEKVKDARAGGYGNALEVE